MAAKVFSFKTSTTPKTTVRILWLEVPVSIIVSLVAIYTFFFVSCDSHESLDQSRPPRTGRDNDQLRDTACGKEFCFLEMRNEDFSCRASTLETLSVEHSSSGRKLGEIQIR